MHQIIHESWVEDEWVQIDLLEGSVIHTVLYDEVSGNYLVMVANDTGTALQRDDFDVPFGVLVDTYILRKAFTVNGAVPLPEMADVRLVSLPVVGSNDPTLAIIPTGKTLLTEQWQPATNVTFTGSSPKP